MEVLSLTKRTMTGLHWLCHFKVFFNNKTGQTLQNCNSSHSCIPDYLHCITPFLKYNAPNSSFLDGWSTRSHISDYFMHLAFFWLYFRFALAFFFFLYSIVGSCSAFSEKLLPKQLSSFCITAVNNSCFMFAHALLLCHYHFEFQSHHPAYELSPTFGSLQDTINIVYSII